MSESKIIIAFGLPNHSVNDIENALNASQEILHEQDILSRQVNVYPEIELGLAIVSGPAITIVANTNERAVSIYYIYIYIIIKFN